MNKGIFSINLDVLLYPTAVYLYPLEKVSLNKQAQELLGIKDKHVFNIDWVLRFDLCH